MLQKRKAQSINMINTKKRWLTILKIILACICIISLILPLIFLLVGNAMQGYYKNYLNDSSESEEEIKDALSKKSEWARICESPLWICFIIVSSISASAFILLCFFKKQNN